jgi:hypothetical protein
MGPFWFFSQILTPQYSSLPWFPPLSSDTPQSKQTNKFSLSSLPWAVQEASLEQRVKCFEQSTLYSNSSKNLSMMNSLWAKTIQKHKYVLILLVLSAKSQQQSLLLILPGLGSHTLSHSLTHSDNIQCVCVCVCVCISAWNPRKSDQDLLTLSSFLPSSPTPQLEKKTDRNPPCPSTPKFMSGKKSNTLKRK